VSAGLRAFAGTCALLAGLALALPALAADIAIELVTRTEQRGAALLLKDVASIDGDDSSRGALCALALPAKGKVGDTVVYAREEIAALVARTQPDLAQRLRWSGPARVLVKRQGVLIEPREYIGWATERLQARWAPLPGRIELKPVNDYRPLVVPAGSRTVEARFAGDEVRRTSKVWLDVAIDGQPYTTATVVFDVRWWRPALVLKQRGDARQRLRPEMATQADVDVSLANGELVTDAAQLHGKRLRHDTDAGQPLTADDVEEIPPIELGSTVRVFTQVGRVAIQTLAVAQRDGQIGQRIAVKSAGNEEQLMVEVIGENRAIVSEKQTH
jgi:flagella basal body P-ring formation protein FlgA